MKEAAWQERSMEITQDKEYGRMKRVLLKLSGEALAGDKKTGFDEATCMGVDLTASIMCLENKMPMLVFGLNEENSIVETMTGTFTGTRVTV